MKGSDSLKSSKSKFTDIDLDLFFLDYEINIVSTTSKYRTKWMLENFRGLADLGLWFFWSFFFKVYALIYVYAPSSQEKQTLMPKLLSSSGLDIHYHEMLWEDSYEAH